MVAQGNELFKMGFVVFDGQVKQFVQAGGAKESVLAAAIPH